MAALNITTWLIAVASTLCYGSYFVPARKYEIHDGLVFQWYQCSGILLAGILFAVLRNSWNEHGEYSPGFYVAPEGLVTGVLFQIANITATFSVKACGLGNYYTLHQVTNLGFTFLVGVLGPAIGIPAVPPHNVLLAMFGFTFVLLGMIPVMVMEQEPVDQTAATPRQSGNAEAFMDNGADVNPAMGSGERSGATEPAQEVPSRFEHLFRRDLPPELPRSGSTADVTMASGVPQRHTLRRPPALQTSGFQAFNSQTWDGTMGRPRLVEPNGSMMYLGAPGLIIKETPEAEISSTRGDTPTATSAQEPLLQQAVDSRKWWWGICLALLAGTLNAVMYVPLLPWRARLLADHVDVKGFDSFFALCVGLYLTSSAWMVCGGAWKRYRGQRMEKSVLRPALVSGIIYAGGSLSFLYAIAILPYAICYAVTIGGGLAVSLLWSVLVFNEARSSHNRRCVLASFVGVLIGVSLLGMSA